MKYKVLIVEDNAEIADLVQMHLRDIHCESDIAADGGTGVSMFLAGNYDLVVLDLMLPVEDGLSVCRKIRAEQGYVPILMLTAKSTELDRVLGLEVGADDYLTKPFSIPELIARVKALFRRVEAMSAKPAHAVLDDQLQFSGMSIDSAKRHVLIDNKNITLTAKEFDLLLHFARNPGRVYSRVDLLDQVWGYHHEGYEHTVNSHINRLRAKIEQDPTTPVYIKTVWGVGYKVSDDIADT
ncbi:MAG: response regulator transcription factor [Pseudomonadales bacterium]|nr:response regulator transcription factor [Pseudomonadales bacterium]